MWWLDGSPDTSARASMDSVLPVSNRFDIGLRALLGNLVDNALRYGRPGGRVDVELALDGDAAVLTVSDDGPGIPAAERDAMFERFARGGQADAPGSGLGLAIVRRIAERHGATVALGDGPDGRGLEVAVRFPR